MTQDIQSCVLRDGDTEVTVLNVGCSIQDWKVGGQRVVLGHADVEEYRANPASMGLVAGRIVNRTRHGTFTMDGVDYTLPVREGSVHHLHGGPGGLGWQIWEMEQTDARSVVLRQHSPDGQNGYPGNVDFTLRLSLDGPALTWDMTGMPDRKTPINLAQHLYFNLLGEGTIRGHTYQLDADQVTVNDDTHIPTGAFLDVDGTRFDFRQPRTLDQADPDRAGYDLNYVLNSGDGPQASVVAENGMRLDLWTDQPGLQLYTCAMLKAHGTPWPGQVLGPFAGFCMEAQAFPDALNRPEFGDIFCMPDAPYRQVTTIRIAQG